MMKLPKLPTWMILAGLALVAYLLTRKSSASSAGGSYNYLDESGYLNDGGYSPAAPGSKVEISMGDVVRYS